MKNAIELLTGKHYPVSGGFWNTDPNYPEKLKPHIGTDFPLNRGTQLKVFTYLQVIKIGGHKDYGIQVFLYDPNNDLTHHFAHLQELHPELSVGDGRYIGFEFAKSGASGVGFNGQVISEGVVPHLHWGVAKGRVTDTSKGHQWLSIIDVEFDCTNADGSVTGGNVENDIVGTSFTFKGGTPIYNDNPVPTLYPDQPKRNYPATVIKESGEWLKIRVNAFSPTDVWIYKKDAGITVSTDPSLKLNNEPLYGNSTTTSVANNITGTFYYWDDKVINGRRRITNKSSSVGVEGQVTGFIKS